MSRCKACNNAINEQCGRAPRNKHTGQEDDLCLVCLSAYKYAYILPEYVGGRNPQNGVTQALDNSD